jgi:N-methylhydantoinase A
MYRITVDTGGTFTDVVVSDGQGGLHVGKAPTTPARAFDGVSEALAVIARQLETDVEALLRETSLFIYSTTRATNAILEGKTAKTAFLTTEGFADTLVLREGGKLEPFNLSMPYGAPYVPRNLTYEARERIGADGEVVTALDEADLRQTLEELRARGVEAVAVSLLWSIVNPVHEQRIGELIEEELPGVAYTLSHQLNPIIREYRRGSSTAIDASLKPLMGSHLSEIGVDLRAAGFAGELMVATSFGGVMHVDDLAQRPIYSVKSGPALAPVGATVYAEETGAKDVIVCDTGGTSFDVSLIRDGAINFTRETWLGQQWTGHITGMSSVDVRSIGAGGGSIAWIDSGGLLRVGPESAGAEPGPACYGRGGTRPTVTDAAAVLGYLQPDYFLGGRMRLDHEAAVGVLSELAEQLGRTTEEAAAAVMAIANEHMVRAIQEITINEGVDPRESLVVAGGGAAGLGIVEIVRELGCRTVLVPRTAGALSAAGGQYSDIVAEYSMSRVAVSDEFAHDEVNETLRSLDALIEEFSSGLRERGYDDQRTDYFVEGRYAYQVWELEVPVATATFTSDDDVQALTREFDAVHERVFAVAEAGQRVEFLTWKARLTSQIPRPGEAALVEPATNGGGPGSATEPDAYFPAEGWLQTPLYEGAALTPGARIEGPAIVAEPTSTLVLPPGSSATVTPRGHYLVEVL